MATTMEDIFPNIFANINQVSISRGTFIKWSDKLSGSGEFIENVTKTSDSVHDELGHEENNPKPKDWEDEMILFTKLYDLPIYKQLSIYGKCFVVEKSSQNEGGIPWKVPNNNETCYVKDCFAGSCVPGLNNLLDQSAASMQSFLDITPKLVNPLNGGGLGQQFFSKGSINLKYTAYFNYDVLMFKFIIETMSIQSNSTLNGLAGKLANYPQGDNLTAKDIQIINTVNLNYIWAFLMCFCYESVESDKYLNEKENQQHKEKYVKMLKRLTHIRFDGFMLNKDGFISNPFFYNRRGTAYYVLDENTASYIDAMTTKIYKIMECVVIDSTVAAPGQSLLTVTVSGSQYITSQSIAASCITSIIGKIKSVICRNSKAKDPISNACMNELNTLFQDKDSKAHGWNILKFSGDSSHVVFGYIMEKIFAYFPNTKQIKIVYLISERPLAARLLSDAKTVFMSGTKVFNENFSGEGMENKTDIHAAYYIECDPSQSIISTIENFIEKVYENEESEISKNFLKDPQFIIVIDKNDLREEIYKLIGLDGIDRANNTLNTDPEKKTKAAEQLLLLLENDPFSIFLKEYEIIKLKEKYDRLVGESNNFTELGKKLISERLILRLTSKTNWSWLVNNLKTTPTASDDRNGIKQFKNFSEIMSIFQSLKEKGQIDFVKEQHDTLLGNPGYKVVYDKITTVYIKSGPKYINFKEDRTNDYLLTTKGVGDKIPNQVELIFQNLISVIDTVLDVHESFKTQLGGGDVPIIQFAYSENNPHPDTLKQMKETEFNQLSKKVDLKSFNTKQLIALYENTNITDKKNINKFIEKLIDELLGIEESGASREYWLGRLYSRGRYKPMYEILIDDTVNALKTVIISDDNNDTIQTIIKDLMDFYYENVVPLENFTGWREKEINIKVEKFLDEYRGYRVSNLDAYKIIYSRIDLLCSESEAESKAESEAKIQQNINFIKAAFKAMNFPVSINDKDLKNAIKEGFNEEFPKEKITKLENMKKLQTKLNKIRNTTLNSSIKSFTTNFAGDIKRLGTTPEMFTANMRNFIIVQPIKLDTLERMRGNISGSARNMVEVIITSIINFKKKYNHAYTISPLVEEYINSPPLRRGDEYISILDCFIKNGGIKFDLQGGKQVTRKRRPYKSKNIRKHRIKTKTKKAKKRKTIKKKAKY